MQRPGGAGAALALEHDLVGAIEFAHARGELAERDELRAGDAADVPLIRLAHVEEHEVVAAIELRLQLLHGDVRHVRFLFLRGFGLRDAAELIVVDQLGDRRIGPSKPGTSDRAAA